MKLGWVHGGPNSHFVGKEDGEKRRSIHFLFQRFRQASSPRPVLATCFGSPCGECRRSRCGVPFFLPPYPPIIYVVTEDNIYYTFVWHTFCSERPDGRGESPVSDFPRPLASGQPLVPNALPLLPVRLVRARARTVRRA